MKYLLNDWAACLLGQGVADLLPLLVLIALGRAVTGYFYVAFVVATGVWTFAQAFSTSLLVEAAHREGSLHSLARRTMVRCVSIVVPAVLIATLFAPWLLRVFGSSYSDEATGTLRMLLVASLFQTAIGVAMSIERIRGRANRVLRYQASAAGISLALAFPLMHILGVSGIAFAWLIGQAVTALFTIPTLKTSLAGTTDSLQGNA